VSPDWQLDAPQVRCTVPRSSIHHARGYGDAQGQCSCRRDGGIQPTVTRCAPAKGVSTQSCSSLAARCCSSSCALSASALSVTMPSYAQSKSMWALLRCLKFNLQAASGKGIALSHSDAAMTIQRHYPPALGTAVDLRRTRLATGTAANGLCVCLQQS
jgi:hypothetical protein